jgi:cytochrome c-type biogenesis protein CcmH
MTGTPIPNPHVRMPGRPQGAMLGCLMHGALFAIWIALIPLVATAFLMAAPGPDAIEQRVQAISDQLRCPTCQAISVKDSEAAFSVQIRDKVRHMLEEGQSEDQIKAYFVSRYGEWILRSPPKAGVGLVVWVLPFAAILVAGGLIAWGITRRSRARAVAGFATLVPASGMPLTPEQRERIQADLKRFEEED